MMITRRRVPRALRKGTKRPFPDRAAAFAPGAIPALSIAAAEQLFAAAARSCCCYCSAAAAPSSESVAQGWIEVGGDASIEAAGEDESQE